MEIHKIELDLIKITHKIVIEGKPITLIILAVDLSAQLAGTQVLLHFTKGTLVPRMGEAEFYPYSHATEDVVIAFIKYLKENNQSVARKIGVPSIILIVELDTILDKIRRL